MTSVVHCWLWRQSNGRGREASIPKAVRTGLSREGQGILQAARTWGRRSPGVKQRVEAQGHRIPVSESLLAINRNIVTYCIDVLVSGGPKDSGLTIL